MQEREKLGSRIGFILLSAACAIGLGNIWKFPYIVGIGGGGLFVLVYVLFLVILGLPVLNMEFAVGRGSQASTFNSFRKLEKEGQKWHIQGIPAVIGNIVLMMFYVVVCGWMLYYFIQSVKGTFVNVSADFVVDQFENGLLGSPKKLVLWSTIVCLVGGLVCILGLQNGVEKITVVMMVTLFVIMIAMAVYSFTLPGAKEGFKFYLVPDFSRIKETGFANVIVGAMNQAFFTLSVGMGSMSIFGSYIGKERSLLGESVRVVALDTFVAFMAGVIIFPAIFTYNIEPAAGPSLIFITLPNIFSRLPGGHFWGSLFFLLMTFAAFSTVIAVFENIISSFMEMFNLSRIIASIIVMLMIAVLAVPCCFGFSVWSWGWLKPFGGSILDLEDFIVSNLVLPCGALVYVLFCTHKKGWGWDNYLAESNTGDGLKFPSKIRFYCTYILPLIIAFVIVYGIWDKFRVR
ncbi:MAG: sodium-dependent transporter [Treponema sp.]|nr:sodium-dependent transporter [Treponema sp.]